MRLPAPRSLAIGLLVSCTVNLFLGGMFLGGLVRGHVLPASRAGGALPSLEWARRALGKDPNPTLEAVVARHGVALHERAMELREARQRVDRRLEASSFDRHALASALEDVGERSAALQAQLAAALVELAEGLTPEQRRRLVEVRRAPPGAASPESAASVPQPAAVP